MNIDIKTVNKVNISLELGDYAIEVRTYDNPFYDTVLQFQDETEIDKLIAGLTNLKDAYLRGKA